MTDMDKFPEDDKRWLMHVGYLAQNWAGVETILDGIVRQLHVYYGGEKFEPSPPQAFGRKRTFIRKAFAAHPKLVAFSEELESHLETATRLASIRHWALHSGWAETDATTAMLRRYSRSDSLRLEEQKFTIDEIYDAAAECATLTMVLTFFGQRAFGFMTEEQIKEVFRELCGKLGTPFPYDDSAGH